MSRGQHRPITRNRQVKSCDKCIMGKRRCDQNQPNCGRCIRIGVECSYFNKKSRKGDTLEMNSAEDDLKSLRFTVEVDENIATKNFRIVTNFTGELSVFISSGNFPYYELSAVLNDAFKVIQGNAGIHDVFDFTRLTTRRLTLQQLKEKMPVKLVGEYFISHFFEEIYILIPIFDRNDILVKWNSYNEDPSSFTDMNAMILLFGVFFSSCVSIQLNEVYRVTSDTNSLDLEKLKIEYFDCVENLKYLLKTDTCPSIPAISSLGLMYYVSSLSCHGLASRISTLQRYCQMAGVHRRTSNLSELSLKELLFCYVTYLDSLVSLYQGLPPQVDSCVSEVLTPSHRQPNDVYLSGLFARFYCVRLCANLKMLLNRIEGPNRRDLRKMKKKFLEIQEEVNSINEEISRDTSVSQQEASLLKVGNQLFLGRAAYSLAFFEIIVKKNSGGRVVNINVHNKKLLTKSLLLMNESFMLVSQALNSKKRFLWFARNAYPIEAILIVMSNLEKYPTETINFRELEAPVRYTRCASINYVSGDIRLVLLEKCCDTLLEIEFLWPPLLRSVFRKIITIKQNLIPRK